MKMMPQMMPPTLSPVAVRYRLLANTRRLRTFYASISPRDTGQTVGEIYYAIFFAMSAEFVVVKMPPQRAPIRHCVPRACLAWGRAGRGRTPLHKCGRSCHDGEVGRRHD